MSTYFLTHSLSRNARLLAAGVFLLAAGCNGKTPGKITQDNLDLLRQDMSAADVKAILGEPTESKSEPIPIVGGTKTTYIFQDHDNEIVVVLKNDNLQTKEGHFGGPAR